MQHGTDNAPALHTLFIDGVEVGEGTHVILTSEDNVDEAGEVWGVKHDGMVLVSWPYRIAPNTNWKYEQTWHHVSELNPVG